MSNCHALTQPAGRSFTQRLTALIVQSLTLQRSRYSLADLEPHLLVDIGLTSEQALREAARPVWDAPQGWQTRNWGHRCVTFRPNPNEILELQACNADIHR